jgi:hypothetical protein
MDIYGYMDISSNHPRDILIRSVSRQRALIRNPLLPVSFFIHIISILLKNSCPVNSGRYRSVLSVTREISLFYSQRESGKN